MIQQIVDSTGVIHLFKGKQSEPIKLVIGDFLTAEIMDIFPTGVIQIRINNRIITAQLQRELPLNKGDIVYLLVEKPLSDGTIPLRVISNLETENYKQTLLKIQEEIPEKLLKFIEAFFSQQRPILSKLVNQTQTGDQSLTQVYSQNNVNSLKESTYTDLLKTILSIPFERLPEKIKESVVQRVFEFLNTTKTTSRLLTEFIDLLDRTPQFREHANMIKALFISSTDLTPDKLKKSLLDSGVVLEAKLKEAILHTANFGNVKEDLRVIFQNIINRAKIDGAEELIERAQGILRQIDSYQVISKNLQSFFTFLPIHWNEIEGGHIGFKSLKREGKELYSVFVSLQIREDNYLNFVVVMINKIFYISFSGDEKLLNIIKNKENSLRESFRSQGFNLGEINYVSNLDDLVKQWNLKEGLLSLTV